MKAVAVRPADRVLEIVDHPEPSFSAPTQALLRVLDVGICGTDREIASFEFGTPPRGADHLVIGHESAAEVVEVGPGVTRLRPGDVVVPMVRRPCPAPGCRPCRHDRPDFCGTGRFLEHGIRGAHGFMTERLVEDERYLVAIPRALRAVAALVEPLTIAEKALLQLEAVQSRLPWTCAHAPLLGPGHCHRALVLGAGPVGLLGAMAFAVRGFETIVLSLEPEGHPKAELARAIGARYVAAADRPIDALLLALDPIDVLYEAAGAPRLALDALAALAPNAIAIVTGVPHRHAGAGLDPDRFVRGLVLGNQVLLGTVNAGPDAFTAAVRDLEQFDRRWPGPLRGLITGRFPIEACRELLLGPPTGIKSLVSFEGLA
jgi:threonine dehydrogenase-like Zn-dependent dehydrogenase